MNIEPSVSARKIIRGDDDPLYFDPVLETKYYNYYFSYGRHFKPTKVFEIGVRAGYTAYFILQGAAHAVQKYRGIDLETYLLGSTDCARKLLRPLCSDAVIEVGNSHELQNLGDEYDLIHVDGDHSYEGKLADLQLALNSLAPNGVIVVDDCHPSGAKEVVHRATVEFAELHQLKTTWYAPLCGSTQNPTNGHLLLQR